MDNKKCSYHGNEEAVTSCERCNRPLCLRGKRVYEKHHTSGRYKKWTTEHTYCPPCLSDVAIDESMDTMRGSILLIIIGLVLALGLSSEGAFAIFIPLAIVGVGILRLLKFSGKADEARKDEKRFLESLSKSPDGITSVAEYNKFKSYTRPDKKWNLAEIHCFVCGEKLHIDSEYCTNCGDPTIDEMEFMKNKK